MADLHETFSVGVSLDVELSATPTGEQGGGYYVDVWIDGDHREDLEVYFVKDRAQLGVFAGILKSAIETRGHYSFGRAKEVRKFIAEMEKL